MKKLNIKYKSPIGDVWSWKFLFLMAASLCLSGDFLMAQEEEIYVQTDQTKGKDHIFKDYIKTVRLHVKDQELSYPYIPLDGSIQLELRFDDLAHEYKEYYYTIVHYSSDWEPSTLDPFDYIAGFLEADLDDYQFSFKTLIPYTQYRLDFPNRLMRPKVSGNYLLKVYEPGQADQPIFTRRFLVYDNRVAIYPSMGLLSASPLLQTHQRLEFSANTGTMTMRNPYTDLKVVILQNGRWDNAIRGIRPMVVFNKEAIFNHQNQMVFKGGKEFRFFDARSFKFRTEWIEKIIESDTVHQVYLNVDSPREQQHYRYWQDINGKYIIGDFDTDFDEIDAHYMQVHFTLEMEEPITNGNIYVFGGLTDWSLTKEAQMHYNYKRKAYQTTLYLKQGYYNYSYVFRQDGKVGLDETRLEGSYYLAENDYIVLIYYYDLRQRYDELVGIKYINSLN